MAKVKYDASEIEDAPQFEQAPVALYRFKVASAEDGDSKAGQPMLTLRLELTHDAQGKKIKKDYAQVWHRVPIGKFEMTPGWAFRFTEFLNAVGLKQKGVLDTDKIEGLTGQVKLRTGKDEDGDYRPEVSKLMALSDDDADDDADAGEDEYTEDDLKEMDNDELKAAAEEVGVDVPKRLTAAGKKKLVAAILETQGEDDDEDDDNSDDESYDEDMLGEMDADELSEVADELGVDMPKGKLVAAKKKRLIAALLEAQDEADGDDDDDDADDGDEYDEMSKSQLVKEARSRKIKVKSGLDEDDIRELLREDDGDDDADDDADDDDDDTDYEEWELDDLKSELKERGLKTTGRKAMLVARLNKDDESGDDPF